MSQSTGNSARQSTLQIVHLYPHLLGTYGDAGNARVLHQRARARGITAQVVPVHPGDAVPRTGDIYLLGGGEDAKQTAAVQELRADGALGEAAARGAVILGICAGYQLLGHTFLGVGGAITAGLGLLDVTTDRLERRAVGNMWVRSSVPGVPDLVGFENHGGATSLGSDAAPLGAVVAGVGNGDGQHTEGAVQGKVYGTYLHGPALALNPALADRMLTQVVGELTALDDTLIEEFRRHRREIVIPATQRTNRWRRLRNILGRDTSPSGAVTSLSSNESPLSQ